jgi:hypothetical protein
MATSVVPRVIDALIQLAKGQLTDVQVYDGYPVSESPDRDLLLIGVEDPDATGFEVASSSEQSWAQAGYRQRSQTGDVTCAALSWNGNGDAKDARDRAYATVAAVESLLREDPTLGLVPEAAAVLVASYGARETLSQIQDEHGATATVAFTVHFEARI